MKENIMKSCVSCFVILATLAAFRSAKGQNNTTVAPSVIGSSTSIIARTSVFKTTSSISSNHSSSKSSSKSSSSNKSIVNSSSESIVNSSSSKSIVSSSSSIYSSASTAIHPSRTHTVPPANTTVHHNSTGNSTSKSTAHLSTSHGSVSPSKPTRPTSKPTSPTPKPTRATSSKSSGKDDKDYDNMKKRMWIAASFAIIFGVATVVLAYLVYRQRKINRELGGDPATSRLL